MRRRARALLVTVASSALLLSGCTAGDEDAATEQSSAAADACRDIVDASGATVCVPADPQRIVTLDSLMTLPTLLSVGANVVGATTIWSEGHAFPDYIDEAETADIETVGSMADVDVEAVAALAPDLIFASVSTAEEQLDKLAEIAPVVTVSYAFYSSTWLDDVRLVAEVVDASDEIEDEIADYEEHVAEVAELLGEQGEEHTLSRVDIYAGTPLYYLWGCTWFGTVLSAAGVDQPAAQVTSECTEGDVTSTIVYLSEEQLGLLDADAIVTYEQQATADSVGVNPVDELTGNALWDALPAVQDGDVTVGGDAWGVGVSLAAANAILDDVTTIFTDGS